jgi:hypothetical protein
MEKYIAIIDAMAEAVLETPTRVAGTDGEIRHVGQMHRHFASFSGWVRQWSPDETISLDSRDF